MRLHFAPVALTLCLLFGCEHSSGALTRSVEGISIVATPSGGSAEPVRIGELYVDGLDDATRFGRGFGGRGYGSLGLRSGSGYGGGSGRGGGGGGSGRGGSRGDDGLEPERSFSVQVEGLPFAYAEISLPFRGGTPGRFPSRQDAKVSSIEETRADHLSTFAIDVDTAAYSIARKALSVGRRPEPTLVRSEEMLNYFRYDYQPPTGDRELFSIQVDGARSPLDQEQYILRIGIMARAMSDAERLPANLVFLVDTSCSMTSADKLELAKKSLTVAVGQLDARDQVAIATYAGGVSLVLPPTRGDRKELIFEAIDALHSAGGTAMESGMVLAYEQAAAMQRPDSITRIIVCSDGDANIGASGPDEILAQIRHYVERGITMSTIGFGDGNYRDFMMERLANQGNGNYFYVDSERQAERVLGRDLIKMLQDVAQDVKIQVQLDASVVRSYRLVGYENRAIADEDFRVDAVDAGEIGAGHQVTALYELELLPGARGQLGTVRVRAKRPGGTVAKETSLGVAVSHVLRPFSRAPADLRFASAVVGASELLRGADSGWRWAQVLSIAEGTLRGERDPDREEFVQIMRRASALPEFASLTTQSPSLAVVR